MEKPKSFASISCCWTSPMKTSRDPQSWCAAASAKALAPALPTSMKTWDFTRETYTPYWKIYGGFLKWGYPQLSSILVGFSVKSTIYFGVPPFMETPHVAFKFILSMKNCVLTSSATAAQCALICLGLTFVWNNYVDTICIFGYSATAWSVNLSPACWHPSMARVQCLSLAFEHKIVKNSMATSAVIALQAISSHPWQLYYIISWSFKDS